MTDDPIDINPEFREALALIETGQNVFLTGRAGTGKSTFLRHLREQTDKKVAVLAPTGVAALNVQGQTVHSFCRFKPHVTISDLRDLRLDDSQNLYKQLDLVIIDEISMVRADLLDCVDRFLRLNGKRKNRPFGGLQVLFIGDLYQLPPVVRPEERHIFTGHYDGPYFFQAKVMEDLPLELVELKTVYRQQDADFIELLNGIRQNQLHADQLAVLNGQVSRGAGETEFVISEDFCYAITLTTTNAKSEELNAAKLAALPGRVVQVAGVLSGNFGQGNLPTGELLELKPRSQIMMLNNDNQGRWVNGSIGQIRRIEESKDGITKLVVRLDEGRTVEVEPFTWEMTQLRLDGGIISAEPVGSFTQFPLKLAWAVTIHKSQGKTFDRVTIDLGRGAFAHGQTYVALSRCRTLAGIRLVSPVHMRDIQTDPRIDHFFRHWAEREITLPPSEAEAINLF